MTRLADVRSAVEVHLPLVAAERAASETAFRMSPAVFGALGPTDVFRVLAPGVATDVSLEVWVDLLIDLAIADPAIGWAAMNSNGAASQLYKLDPSVAEEILADGNHFFGAGLPPVGKMRRDGDHMMISGRWPVVSGCEVASWFALNCVEDGSEDPAGGMGFVFVPADAIEIERTWMDVIAVRGSGSHAVTVDEVRVPDTAVARIFAPDVTERDFSGFPPFGLQSLTIAAMAVGIGAAAVQAAIDQASTRVSVASGQGWIDYPSVQNSMASADIAIHCARAGLLEVCRTADSELADEGSIGERTHAHLHSIADHSLRTARTHVSDLFAVGSVDAIHQGHLLEQSLRDLHGFSVQWERYRQFHYDAGRVLLGGTPTSLFY